MKTIKNILQNKPADIYSVDPNSAVLHALEVMMDKNISALLVISEGELKGIFTERDYARKIILNGRSSKSTRVEEVMTADLITASSNDSIEHCMQIMTSKHIRHLPVIEETKLSGIISIGDVIGHLIHTQKQTIEHLEQYINS
jgi:CBS domain-containing protein